MVLISPGLVSAEKVRGVTFSGSPPLFTKLSGPELSSLPVITTALDLCSSERSLIQTIEPSSLSACPAFRQGINCPPAKLRIIHEAS